MRFVILVVIMVIAVVAGFIALQLASGNKQTVVTGAPGSPTVPQVTAVDVLVARQPIPLGSTITEQMVERQPWPQHLVLEGFIVGDAPQSDVVGMVARADFQAHEPLTRYKLVAPNDANFLAGGLEPGMRAITISIDAVTGVAGYIFPGDRVDLLITHNIVDQMIAAEQSSAPIAGGSNQPKVSELLINNVRVLAVDLRNTNPPAEEHRNVAPRAPSNITLEVSAEDAQRVRLAEKNGTLSMVLRSHKDRENLEMTSPSILPAVTHVNIEEVAPPAPKPVLIIRGTQATMTGGGENSQQNPLMIPRIPGTEPANIGASMPQAMPATRMDPGAAIDNVQ